jgi:hypothetical protein
MLLWHFGNTTVRSPFRLRAGLIALSNSRLQGNLRGKDAELAFCQLLGDAGVVSLKGDETYSVGRKWRSALTKLGFLYPKLEGDVAHLQTKLGQADCITDNGWRLINAETVSGWQECFLRALASYLESNYDAPLFSPLRLTLSVLLEIEKQTGESLLRFTEMALFVQQATSVDSINNLVKEIISFRNQRDKAQNKREFDNLAFQRAAKAHQKVPGTFRDYADTNFRYLKATGLVRSKGRGITLMPEKKCVCLSVFKGILFP